MKSSEVLMNYKTPTLPEIQSKAKELDNLRGMVEGEQGSYAHVDIRLSGRLSTMP